MTAPAETAPASPPNFCAFPPRSPVGACFSMPSAAKHENLRVSFDFVNVFSCFFLVFLVFSGFSKTSLASTCSHQDSGKKKAGKPEKTRKPRKNKNYVQKMSIKFKVFKDFASENHEHLRVSLFCFVFTFSLFFLGFPDFFLVCLNFSKTSLAGTCSHQDSGNKKTGKHKKTLETTTT
jgi:hypothetical protein